jgi:pimeloyl-ACP methyl ester carboxylesterase
VTTATSDVFELVSEVHGAGQPVLFISGTNDTRDGWDANVPAFDGFQCITFDNRDAGDSPRATTPYTVADMARDASAVLDHLGVHSAHVIGHSMGGTIAQELALLAPERIRSLVLVNTFAWMDPYTTALTENWKRLRQQLSAEDFARAAIFSWCGATTIETLGMDALIEFVAPVVAAQEPEAFARQLDATFSRDRRAMIGAITAPTLVVHGAEDTTVRLARAHELAAGIPGARLELFERSGHGTLFEQPEEFNATVLQFLRQNAA